MQQIALIFDDQIRPDTTGYYCLRALRQLIKTAHFSPKQMGKLPADFDLYINIDDGLDYTLNPNVGPWALWAIDTHLNPNRILRRATKAHFVFAAQRNGVDLFRAHGANCLGWLPLAADPDIHKPLLSHKKYDVCFVGHINCAKRTAFCEILHRHFPSSFIGQRFFDEMVRIYSESKIVTNLSIADDLNMRVFEALACGSFLMTNNLPEIEKEELFKDSSHLTTFSNFEDFIDKAEFYLQHDHLRESIAQTGRASVLSEHTYRHRMLKLLDCVSRDMNMQSLVKSPKSDLLSQNEHHNNLISIIIVTFNQLAHTQACIQSIRDRTTALYELIFVDNGSTDGTVDFLALQPDIQLIRNGENRGFPAAANQGILASKGQYILLLNNDVVVTTGWLERLKAFIQINPQVGLVGPVSNNVSGIQKIKTNYASLDELESFAASYTQTTAGQAEYVHRLVGFCLLFRRKLVDEIGLLDERFGIGNFEDDDYCRRAIQQGYRAAIVKDSFVHHFGSATFSGNKINLEQLLIHNQLQFENKWRGWQLPNDQVTSHPSDRIASRIKLSLCMIVRDSARTLDACLQSIRPWVDEIIVVDTGSIDETKAIALSHGATIFDFPWCDDFAAARNESLRHATGEWIFWMDADDVIDESNGKKLLELVNRKINSSTMGFVAQVHCPGPAGDIVSVDHIKLIRNNSSIRFSGRIHEQVLGSIRILGGDVEWTDIFVTHFGSDQSPEGRVRKHIRDLKLLKMELQDTPDDTFALFNLGMTLIDTNDYEGALSALCRSLQLASVGDSHLRKIYALLVQAYMGLKRTETALKTNLQGLAVCPNDPELLFRLGMLYQITGQLDEAIKAFQRIVELPRQHYFMSIDQEIFDIKSWHNLALIYEQQGNKLSAIDTWHKILNKKPTHRPAWWSILSLCHEVKYRYLLKSFATYLPTDNCLYDIQFALEAEHAIDANDHERALNYFKTAQLEGVMTPELLEFACQVAFEAEQFAVACDWLEGLAKHAPLNPSVFHNLAAAYMKQQNHNRAEWAIKKALEIRPAYPPSQAILQTIEKHKADKITEASC